MDIGLRRCDDYRNSTPLALTGMQQSSEIGREHRPRLPAVFAAFFWLGVTSFGGNTAAWLYHHIVQRRHWVTDAEFLSGVALGRITPGSGGVNLTVLIGQRLGGSRGALVAVVALLSGPLAIVLALAIGYARVGWSPALHAVLDGVAAALDDKALSLKHGLRRRAALADDTCRPLPGADQRWARLAGAAQLQCLTTSGHC